MDTEKAVEFAVIGGYLLVLFIIGIVFKSFNKDVSDYFRTGCRGKWWLVGMSAFMSVFSAWTFTGAAGVAFLSGWSVLIIGATTVISFFINAIWFAPWFRQLRAISAPEVIKMRFGIQTQQFYAWMMVVLQMLHSAIHLYGLAIFSSAIFGFDIRYIIILLGSVVLFYSLLGGSWAVMATDFIQSMVLIAVTVLVAILSLDKLGGIDGLFGMIEQQGLSQDFRIFNSPDRFNHRFTYLWAFAFFLNSSFVFNGITQAPRYFGAKDGKEARKAAILAGILYLLGSFIWFIPPMTARLLFADQVQAAALGRPEEAAYAIASINLLPLGMAGLMAVAMFSATMSSMDSGLNRNAAVFTNDIYPAFCRIFKTEKAAGGKLLFLGRIFTFAMGFAIILLAYYFSRRQDKGVLQFMLDIGAILGIPLMVPLFLGLLVKRVPEWSAIFAVGCAAIPATMGFLSGTENSLVQSIPILQTEWTFQSKVIINASAGIAAFLFTGLFWRYVPDKFRKKATRFFTIMKTPVDFEKEVGQANDARQYRYIGGFCAVVGAAICLLMFLPNPWIWAGRIGILFTGGIVLAVGVFMIWMAVKSERQLH